MLLKILLIFGLVIVCYVIMYIVLISAIVVEGIRFYKKIDIVEITEQQ